MKFEIEVSCCSTLFSYTIVSLISFYWSWKFIAKFVLDMVVITVVWWCHRNIHILII